MIYAPSSVGKVMRASSRDLTYPMVTILHLTNNPIVMLLKPTTLVMQLSFILGNLTDLSLGPSTKFCYWTIVSHGLFLRNPLEYPIS